MRENMVRENVENQFISVQHVGGKVNLADLFTKESEGHYSLCGTSRSDLTT